jgi:hypothetical protein
MVQIKAFAVWLMPPLCRDGIASVPEMDGADPQKPAPDLIRGGI